MIGYCGKVKFYLRVAAPCYLFTQRVVLFL